MRTSIIFRRLRMVKARSAWTKGVKDYALDLIGSLIQEGQKEVPEDANQLEILLLNGAKNWNEYSWGGSALVYNGDIAKALCTPSQLKRTKEGARNPNSREEWLDLQTRALTQAFGLIKFCLRNNTINFKF